MVQKDPDWVHGPVSMHHRDTVASGPCPAWGPPLPCGVCFLYSWEVFGLFCFGPHLSEWSEMDQQEPGIAENGAALL